jgi:hypothetical protein
MVLILLDSGFNLWEEKKLNVAKRYRTGMSYKKKLKKEKYSSYAVGTCRGIRIRTV